MVSAVHIVAGAHQKMSKKGKPTRPIISAGTSGKQFRRTSTSSRTIPFPAHPLIVLNDLRAGSLESLDAYLKRHSGIPDRELALELRKLLSGSAARSKFRLIVVDHPDGPVDRGSRPKSKSSVPTARERELAAAFGRQFDIIGKKRLAEEEAGKDMGDSWRTVQRAVAKVASWEALQAEYARTDARRELALKKLRRRARKK